MRVKQHCLQYIHNKVVLNMSFDPALKLVLAKFTPKFPNVEKSNITDVAQCIALGIETRLMLSPSRRLKRCRLSNKVEPITIDLLTN